MSTGLTNTHTARGFSDLYHVFARKQCILCPTLRHGSLTLHCVTSIRDFFCTFARLLVGNKSHFCGLWKRRFCFHPATKCIWIVIYWDNFKQPQAKRISQSTSSSCTELQRQQRLIECEVCVQSIVSRGKEYSFLV